MPASPVAMFDVCACGRHGRVTYPGPDHRPHFWLEVHSKEFGRASVDAAIEWKLIGSELYDTLVEQIDASDLPDTDEEADDLLKAMIGQWNFDLRKDDRLDPVTFHDCFPFG